MHLPFRLISTNLQKLRRAPSPSAEFPLKQIVTDSSSECHDQTTTGGQKPQVLWCRTERWRGGARCDGGHPADYTVTFPTSSRQGRALQIGTATPASRTAASEVSASIGLWSI